MYKWQGSNATNQNYGAALVKKNSNSQDASPQIEMLSIETIKDKI